VKACSSEASCLRNRKKSLESLRIDSTEGFFMFKGVVTLLFSAAHRMVIDMQRVWREAVQQGGVVPQKSKEEFRVLEAEVVHHARRESDGGDGADGWMELFLVPGGLVPSTLKKRKKEKNSAVALFLGSALRVNPRISRLTKSRRRRDETVLDSKWIDPKCSEKRKENQSKNEVNKSL